MSCLIAGLYDDRILLDERTETIASAIEKISEKDSNCQRLMSVPGIGRPRPVLMRMPFALWDALAGVAEILPHPPLNRNQVELMQIDATASDNLPGFRVLGISPRSLEEELEAMLRQST